MEKWMLILIIPIIYMLLVLVLAFGPWSKLSKVDISDYYKVSAGAAFPLVFLGICGGYHSAFAIPGSMGFVYAHGVGWVANGLWTLFIAGASFVILGARISYLGRKNNYLTPADLICDYFDDNKAVRLMVAVAALAFSIGYQMTNVMGPAILIAAATNGKISYDFACTAIILVTASYVWRRGVRGTMWTTILQALWMFIAVWVAAAFAVSLCGGVGPMMSAVQQHRPEMLTLPGSRNFLTPAMWTTWAAIAIGIGGALKPCNWPFLYSSRGPKTTTLLGFTLPLYLSGIYVPVVFIGLAAAVVVPGLTGVKADDSFPLMLFQYAPVWFTGLIVAGAMGAGMSTLDAEYNVSSCMIVEDIYKKFIKKDASPAHYLFVGRSMVVVLAILSWILVHYRFDIVAFVATLVNVFVIFYAPAVVAALFPSERFKVTAYGVVAGWIASLIALIIAGILYPNPYKFHYGFWVLISNVSVMIIVSAFTRAPSRERREKMQSVTNELFISA